MNLILIGIYTLLTFSRCIIVSGKGVRVDKLPIFNSTSMTYDSSLILYIDPPSGSSCPTALGVFARANNLDAVIYYDALGGIPSLNSSSITYNSPYIQIDTPFGYSRNRTLTLIAVYTDEYGDQYRSDQFVMYYYIEGAARPNSYGFLIPGLESGGYFMRFAIEVTATERAQTASSQEFADFYTNLGIGTYASQVQALDLLSLDPDLTGFEGGFPVNTSDKRQYGILIPYHNGNDFFGKVVRVDLQAMSNASLCLQSYLFEWINTTTGQLQSNGTVNSSSEACVYILDLSTLHSNARGFRRGFINYPYGYLSAGQYDVLVRLNLEDLSLNTTRTVELSRLDRTYGGYSGGFADGSWACFSPYRTFAGPVGGIRSNLPVDAHRLTPYYYSVMLCLNDTAWGAEASVDTAILQSSVRLIDFDIIEDTLRGFSDAIRVGRFAYLTPLNSAEQVYSSKLIRISLGEVDIGTTLTQLTSAGQDIRSIIDILDLSLKSSTLAGYSGLYTSGQYLYLVPYRNAYEPKNGQRGNGMLTRLNMNSFSLSGITIMDTTTTTRAQIPSFADANLRGFSSGFASGYYGLLVPFYNGDFNGKVVRYRSLEATLTADLQELDLMVDRVRPNVYKGYRGGFTSLWQGVVS